MSLRLSRRDFLLAAGLAPVAACSTGGNAAPGEGPQLVHLYSSDHVIAAGRLQRIPFAVVDNGELELSDDAELPVRLLYEGDTVERLTVVGRVVDHDHPGGDDPDHQHADLLRYFSLRTTLDEVGIYDLEVDFGDAGRAMLPIQTFDPNDVKVVLQGSAMPPIATPTFDRPEGIDPLCTRLEGPCPFHEVDAADVIGSGRPLALLVATPALCQTAYCGPVVETLIKAAPEFDYVTFLHLEFWANGADAEGNYQAEGLELAAPVAELGLTFEPSLFLVGGDGTVVDRIDNIFDPAELRAGLQALV
ncbi:MAG: hypothetical protein AAGD35_04860 [Actinomycetota bacterium]